MTNQPIIASDELAELARALGHPHRFEMMRQLASGEHSVEQMAALAGLSNANASHHLQQLRRAGFVQTRRAGKHVVCRLDEGAATVLAALCAFAEAKRATIEAVAGDYLHHREALEPVTRDDLIARLASGEVTLLDVRPGDEFATGHLPGALNYPLEELEKRLAELPSDKEIIAYCRGPHCVLSVKAVAFLQGRGFKVRRFEDGPAEWKAAGLAVEAVPAE